jgi:hypothetical protein
MNEYLEEMDRFARQILALCKKLEIPAELQEEAGEMPVLTRGKSKNELHLQMLYCYLNDEPKLKKILARD